jgi:TolB protein
VHATTVTPPDDAARAAAAVPWTSVGPGWVLAEHSAGQRRPVILYLASPAGRKYALRAPAGLIAWSASKAEALFALGPASRLEQRDLRTGKASTFSLPAGSYALGYAQPSGHQVLAVTRRGSAETLATYSLAGKLVSRLQTVRDAAEISAIGAPNGASFAISAPTGLRLVSSSGKPLRKLTVPSTVSAGCMPVRWWTASSVLAACFTTSGGSYYYQHLYLVPTSGARPTELTPFRASSSYDFGDFDAWRLPSGLYLQSFGACGTLEINKQAANGSVTPVRVPGTSSPSYAVVTAAGPRLLVQTEGCTGRGQLLWLNPATRAETWIFTSGTVQVIPFAGSQDPLVQI